jgi:hypothetical protein
MAFSTGMRLGALVAIAGCASAALRKGAASSAMDRLVVLVLSAFVASALWGLCAGCGFAAGRRGGRGARATGRIVRDFGGKMVPCEHARRARGGRSRGAGAR